MPTHSAVSRNVHDIVSARVPCVWAPPGKEHWVHLYLGHKSVHVSPLKPGLTAATTVGPTGTARIQSHVSVPVLLTAKCECEELHGAQKAHVSYELSGSHEGTCYHHMFALTETLRDIAAQGKIDRKSFFPRLLSAVTLNTEILRVWDKALDIHNARFDLNLPNWEAGLTIDQPLRRTAILRKALNHELDLKVHANARYAPSTGEFLYPPFVSDKPHVTPRPADALLVQYDGDSQTYTARLRTLGAYYTVGERKNGEWIPNTDNMKLWAKAHHVAWNDVDEDQVRTCVFCKETYDRMGRHTEGARHIDNTVQVLTHCLRMTGTMGMRVRRQLNQR